MCSCPGPGTRPPCTRWSGPNLIRQPSWTCPTGKSATATPSSPKRFPAPATRPWRSISPAAWTCGGCRPPSCGLSGIGSGACWTRSLGIGPGSWPGPASAGSRPTRAWSSSPPTTISSARAGGCLACGGGSSRPRLSGPPRWSLASRPTAPTPPNSSCGGISSAGPAGWRLTPTSAHLPAGGAGAGLAASGQRPGRRTRPARLPSRGARPGARVDQGAAGLATSRGRDRGLPPQLPDHRSGPGDRPGATGARAAGRLAARPHHRPADSGPPAHPPPPGADGINPPSPQQPPPSRRRPRQRRAGGCTPARPGAGRRLARAKEASHGQAATPPARP